MRENINPSEKHPTQINLDYRTDEEVRRDMLVKLNEKRTNEFDQREQAAYDEQRQTEWEDDQPRYGKH